MIRPDTAETADPAGTALERVRRAVDDELDRFLNTCAARAPDESMPPLIDVVREFQDGGKRLRPLFCCCGFAAVRGDPSDQVALGVAASLELLHSFALIHDDVMDGSDTRRGRPTVHRRFGAGVPEQRGSGGRRGPGPERHQVAEPGVSLAILLGDACLVWSDELLHRCGVGPRRWAAIRPLVQAMRNELIAGQYLDVTGEGAEEPLDRAWRVIRHKTAAYTVARPLQIGAALGGAEPDLLADCAEFGFPLGEAFQLQDDVLGVFGDPAVTGKSTSDDLRSGKPTVLMGLAWRYATRAQRGELRRLHGDPALDEEGAARLREIIEATGARERSQHVIEARTETAEHVLARMPVPEQVRGVLAELVRQSTHRQR